MKLTNFTAWRSRLNSQLFARLFTWLPALLIPIFAVQAALTYPIEEHAFDAAAFHIWRGVIFSQARAAGAFYPRWVMPINGGLGGPLFNFYSPLSYYLMDALHWFGLPHTLAWRVLVALALIVGSVGMFALGQHLFKRFDCALLAATCFTYAPYYLRDFFERGAPQGMAIALYPLLLLTMLRLAEKFTLRRSALTALTWGAILLLHNLSGLIVAPVVGIVMLYCMMRYGWRTLLPLTIAFIMGTALAAFHILPFVLDAKYIQISAASQDPTVQPALNPVSAGDLFALPTVYDTGLDNNTSGLSIGWLHALMVVLAIPAAILLWRGNRRAESVLLAALILLALVLLWMQLDPASGVWRALRLLDVLQFRVRLLNTFGLIAAVCGGYALSVLNLHSYSPAVNHWADGQGKPSPYIDTQRVRPEVRHVSPVDRASTKHSPLSLAAGVKSATIPTLIALFILVALPSLYPTLQHRYTAFPARPTTADAQAWAVANHTVGLTLTTSKELIPIWRETDYFSSDEVQRIAASPLDALPEKATLLDTQRGMDWLKFRIVAAADFIAKVHVMYFPGWVGYINDKPTPLNPITPTGYTAIVIPAGDSTVELRYEGTAAQHTGDIMSLIALLGVIVGLVIPRPSRRAVAFGDINVARPYEYVVDEVQSAPPISSSPSPWGEGFRVRAVWAVALLAFALLKLTYIDPSTTLFRTASTCDSLPIAQTQVAVRFGTTIQLCGFTLENRTLNSGDMVHVTLYWQLAQKEAEPSYSFVHFLGSSFNPATNNPLWGQQDKQTPGTLPTTLWLTGKLYRDVYDFHIANNTPPGTYQLEVGWTTPSGERLKPEIASGSVKLSEYDSLILSELEVR